MGDKILSKDEIKTYERIIHKKYRNYQWILNFSIAGISIMFVGLTILYLSSRTNTQHNPIKLPILFYWNTLCLLGSSAALFIAQYYYKRDGFHPYKTTLLLILGLGVLFLAGQIAGWMALYNSGYPITHLSSSYLYVISGIHGLHILGAIVFLIYFITKSNDMLKDYATSVIYFTDPIVQSQLRLFSIFWHFLGITWLYLLFFFILLG